MALGLAAGLVASAQGASVDDRLREFGSAAEARLRPAFERAELAYPPAQAALLAFKDGRSLELYARADGGDWRWVQRYPIRAASGVAGPKLREGDWQVPEGRYRVTFLNANSAYHVSLRLDYPNAFDRAMAQRDGRSQLGGDIMIHGRAVSVGCLAMGDPAAEELFTLAARIGMAKLEVLIAPTDLRQRPPPTLAAGPDWVGELYAQLQQELRAYPLPP